MNQFSTKPYPQTAPQVDQRVRTIAPHWGAIVTGKVKKIYQGYRDIVEGEVYESDHGLSVEVDELPPDWPYGKKQRKMILSIDDVEIIK